MSGNILARASVILLALFLAACGGDDSSTPLAGSPSNTGSGDGGTTSSPDTAQAGSIDLVASPVRLETSASSQSALTARVKDSNGVLLEGVTVDFSATNGGTLEVTQAETDQAGVATATLTTDGDARNRTVSITAESGSISDSVSVDISGTSLAIAGPTSISLGSSASLRVSLEDADGIGVANETISLSTDLGSLATSTLTTSSNGIVDVQLNSGGSGGTANVTATAYSGSNSISATKEIVVAGDSFGFTSPTPDTEVDLNVQREVTLQWLVNGNPVADGTQIQFTATRGTFIPASGSVVTSSGEATIEISSTNAGVSTVTASAPNSNSGLSADLTFEFVATTPDQIILQAGKTQLNLNETTEIVAVIRDAENNLVKNQEVTFRLLEDGSGGGLTTSRDITDSQGRASTIYQAGANSSGRDGVEVEATVGGAISNSLTMTVARQALRLAIGTGNEINEPDTVRYVKDYLAIVTDANGAPVENATIELSVLPTGYIKGRYVESADNQWVIDPASPVLCAAEDTNQNGQLDAGEDINGNGTLEPTNSATTNASSVVSGSDGSADFSLLYPQSHCNWVRVELTATVSVDGSESVESSEFFLSCAASDLNDTATSPPGGTEGLYGTAQDCSDPN